MDTEVVTWRGESVETLDVGRLREALKAVAGWFDVAEVSDLERPQLSAVNPAASARFWAQRR